MRALRDPPEGGLLRSRLLLSIQKLSSSITTLLECLFARADILEAALQRPALAFPVVLYIVHAPIHNLVNACLQNGWSRWLCKTENRIKRRPPVHCSTRRL